MFDGSWFHGLILTARKLNKLIFRIFKIWSILCIQGAILAWIQPATICTGGVSILGGA